MIYLLFFSLFLSSAELSPDVNHYLQTFNTSKPLIGLQYVGACKNTNQQKNSIFDIQQWQEFSTEKKQTIINELLVKNAEQQISPFKSLYLKIHSVLYSFLKGKKYIPASVFFGALYNNETLYKTPLNASYRLARYKFDSYEPQNGIISIPFQYWNIDYEKDDEEKGVWETLSTTFLDENAITITAQHQNDRIETYSLSIPTQNIHAVHFLDGRLKNNGCVTEQGYRPIPRGVLITFKNGAQTIWQLPHRTLEDSNLVEVPSTLIPVNYCFISPTSYEYASYLQKRIHQSKYLLPVRLNFQSIIWDSPIRQTFDYLKYMLKKSCKISLGLSLLIYHIKKNQ